MRRLAARTAAWSMTAKLCLGAAGALSGFLGLGLILLAWLASLAGASLEPAGSCTSKLSDRAIPEQLVPIFERAAARYELGSTGPPVLAALTKTESDFGKNMGPSSAGAIGWTQFLPSTWQHYGVDANGDGRRDPFDPEDAIHASARYLRASGAPRDWRKALFTYNHSNAYVEGILEQASKYETSDLTSVACGTGALLEQTGVRRVTEPARIVDIPWQPGEQIDARILADLTVLRQRFHIFVSDGYAPTGHAARGEHPLGLAVDIRPGPSGTWEDIDRLAHWAEPKQNQPRSPFRWVGYDGDKGHGRGDHLHLSWEHAPANGGPPAEWVNAFVGVSGP